MSENEIQTKQEDEISLIDLFAVLLHWKWLITIITGIACVAVVIVCVISLKLPPEKSFMPNKYTPKAQMLINNKDSGGSSLSSALSSSGLGSLASLAGVKVSGAGVSYSALASYFVTSNTIQDAVIQKFNLIERYKIEKYPIASSRKELSKVLSAKFDDETGVFTVSFTDRDPVFAQAVVNYVVDLLEKRFTEIGVDQNKLAAANLEENIATAYNNMLDYQNKIQELERNASYGMGTNGSSIVMDTKMLQLEFNVQQQIYSGLKAQYESLKVTMASEQPIFQILEYAEIPDQKSGPSRGKLCIIVAFAAFFMSVFLAFLLNAIQNIKKDPQAMAKLKGNK
ncbi:MAG: lipopolysaccharide biosynthesis protein [Treponema sp.]|nr:lipopolysaccharide biosynthesis protein [Treponema sp.]